MNQELSSLQEQQTGLGLSAFSWYREPYFWVLMLMTVAIFLPRLTTLTIRGEESRRAVIAREMLDTGDWIVPRTQGVVRLSRPPLQNWMIAGTALATGGMGGWAVRLPGFLCTVLTVALIYWYARWRLMPLGALIAGLAYSSMLQVLEQGRTGETEPIFTALVAASLMFWHGGRDRGWKPAVFWSIGAAFAGLAMLAKGLQAPLYFFAPTWVYLVVSGHWRQLLTGAHALGIAVFLGVVGAWQVPFTLMMGLENSWMIYFWNVAGRFEDKRLSTFILHLFTYPPSVIAGCLAPWSILLLAFLNRDVRRQVGQRKDLLIFLLSAIAICFPSVWIPPEARPRYFMPLFPCFAVLIGMTAELILETRTVEVRRFWTTFIQLGCLAMALIPLGLCVWSLVGAGRATPPFMPTMVYAVLCVTLACLTWRTGIELTSRSMSRGAVALTAFLGLSYVGPMITYQSQRSERLPDLVRELKQKIPEEAALVSFDHVHHVFLHYLGETVVLLPPPRSQADVPANTEYFCVQSPGRIEPSLPFAWEQVASLSVDRNYHEIPDERIIVGRILTASQTAVQPQSASVVK